MEIGETFRRALRVKAILREQGLSAVQLQALTRISGRRLDNIMLGKTDMNASEVTEIAKALNVDYKQILDEYKI